MLHLSGFTITLGKSNHYVRLASVLHMFGVVALLNSSLPSLVILSMLIMLIASMIHIGRRGIPVPAFSKLTYHTQYWLLHGVMGQETRYERACIEFDAGLFFLLTLSNEGDKRKLVLFNDQLTTAQYSALNIIGKIAPKKKQ